MAQSVERLTSAQVMISRSVSLSPVSGSLLTAQSLEPVSYSVSTSLSAQSTRLLSLSLSKINIKKLKKKEINLEELGCVGRTMRKYELINTLIINGLISPAQR